MTRFNLSRALAWSLPAAAALWGCNEPPAVNPWREDSIPSQVWTSPSEQQVLAENHPPTVRQRAVPQAVAPTVAETTPHYPLWWEDPFEDKGDGDQQFAWTWADYVAMPYSYARFHLNTVAWPVSAVVTPPGALMVSDGVIGKDHDAARGVSPDPTATAEDFSDSGGTGTGSETPPTSAPAS